jgi:flagellar biosynthetic protein FliR
MDIVAWALQFALILIRMAGLFLLSPIWGRANVPGSLKIGLALALTFILINFYPPGAMPLSDTVVGYVLLCTGELLVGLILGFVTTLFFSIAFTAGQIIDMQTGFGMVQVYDVQQNIQIPIAGNLLNLVILLCFMLAGGHLRLIEILAHTFEVLPIGHIVLDQRLPLVMLDGFARTFGLAVQVAMPVIAAGLLAEISLGVIVRTAPQMNVFVIGIPLKTLIGLLMLCFIVPVFVNLTNPLFDEMFAYVDKAFEALTIIP